MSITTRRVRHETRLRRTKVVSNTRLTPRMARIIVHSPELEGFSAPGFDDHVRLFFPAPDQTLPRPERGERGLIWPDPPPETRDYTPRHFDAEKLQLTLDFVLHEGGVASDWAERARPGDELGIGGPRGSFIVEGEADWHLLAGDATALPAIARRLAELPVGARAHAVIDVADADEEQGLATRADLDMTWLHSDQGQTLEGWLDQVTLPRGEGFVFFAAEAGRVNKARERFAELGHPSTHLKAANYWHRDMTDAHEH